MSENLKLGASVRAKRLIQNISQKELADRIGCSQSSISRLESGHLDSLSEAKIREICQLLELDLKEYRANEVHFFCGSSHCPRNAAYFKDVGELAFQPLALILAHGTDHWCPACGKPLFNSCPSCKAEFVSGHAFCMKCGAPYIKVGDDLRNFADPKQFVEDHEVNQKRFKSQL